jgi:hypothetical protein
MSEAAKTLLDQFDSLPVSEREQVLLQLLRREAFSDHDLPDHAALTAAADEVFLGLDRHESEE